MKRICLTPRVSGVGGMVSFQHKLIDGLERRGVAVTQDLDDRPYDSVLVIGGTRQLAKLWRVRNEGVRIVQRLDGMNWLHRLPGASGGLRHFLRAEYGNRLLALIRARLAHEIVYQSEFVHRWWERRWGKTTVPWRVIYNGVDLHAYSPLGEHERPTDRVRLLMVEGSLMGGYELGLGVALALGKRLLQHLPDLELMIAGRVAPDVQALWEARAAADEPALPIRWAGLVPREQIPYLDRSAHLLYSSDIHPACPNAVIEALACGLPVAAFDTGALPELVTPEAGIVVPYGGDAWKLEPPDVPALANASLRVLNDLDYYREGARQRAEEAFGLEMMVNRYLEALRRA